MGARRPAHRWGLAVGTATELVDEWVVVHNAGAAPATVSMTALADGRRVAVKIQYPGIARTIRQDFRNLFFFLLPARFSRDWQNLKEQFEDLRLRLERETDYEQEAAMQERVRRLYAISMIAVLIALGALLVGIIALVGP